VIVASRVDPPSQVDPVVRAASRMVGGPWGRHGVLGARRFWTPLRVMLVLTLIPLGFGYAVKSPCQNGVWEHGLQYTHMCYSDVIPLYYSEDLNAGAVPYRDHPVEYPVLTGAFMGAANALARRYDAAFPAGGNHLLPGFPPVQTYFVLTSILLAFCMLAITWTTAATARRRMWDAAMVALAPLLVVHAFTNWDLMAIALAGGALLAWSRQRPVLAGVLLGLGAAAKLYPALFLIPLLALCLRTRKLTAFWWTAGAAVVAWAAVNLPVASAYRDSWTVFFGRNADRAADFDSFWYLVSWLGHRRANTPPGPVQVTPAAATLVFFGLAAVFALAFYARRRPRLPQVLFLTVAVFLLANKVWSPQDSLWLVPLAVLARPSWRLFLSWQAAEALMWVPRMLWFLGTGNKGIDFQWVLLGVLARDAALITYCVFVVRDILRPELDVVRSDGSDDPAGGVLDGAPDVAYGTAVGVSAPAAPSTSD
jgi:uncharacterized membrane protein